MREADTSSDSLSDIDVVLFDMGGVLTPDPWQSIMLTADVGLKDRLGLDSERTDRAAGVLFDKYAVLPDATREDYWRDFGRALGIEFPLETISELEREKIRPNPDLPEAFDDLARKRVRIGVVSDNTSFWFPIQAKVTGVENVAEEQLLFLSFRLRARKNDRPGLFEAAASVVDPERTLVIDDREENLSRASENGFKVLHFTLDLGRSLRKEIARVGKT